MIGETGEDVHEETTDHEKSADCQMRPVNSSPPPSIAPSKRYMPWVAHSDASDETRDGRDDAEEHDEDPRRTDVIDERGRRTASPGPPASATPSIRGDRLANGLVRLDSPPRQGAECPLKVP